MIKTITLKGICLIALFVLIFEVPVCELIKCSRRIVHRYQRDFVIWKKYWSGKN